MFIDGTLEGIPESNFQREDFHLRDTVQLTSPTNRANTSMSNPLPRQGGDGYLPLRPFAPSPLPPAASPRPLPLLYHSCNVAARVISFKSEQKSRLNRDRGISTARFWTLVMIWGGGKGSRRSELVIRTCKRVNCAITCVMREVASIALLRINHVTRSEETEPPHVSIAQFRSAHAVRCLPMCWITT